MKQVLFICISMFMAKFVLGQGLPEISSETEFSIGKTLHINSTILEEERILNIYLPNGYSEDSSKIYPVIYLLDGSKDEDFIHVSGIVQFGSFSWINMIPESIVVGISNVDRKRDFTYPSQNLLDQKEFPTTGASGKFIEFIEKELQPLIDSAYHTSSKKTLIGQSLGGLLATEVLFEQPQLFDNYIIVSPSLWWDDENLLDREVPLLNGVKAVYIAGGKEGALMERTAKALYNKLDDSENDKLDLFYEFFEDKTHGDILHIAVYRAFEEIFKSE
jgi:predicted alpha/beta superfamily hydrolase